jgi:hypothetical protein
MNLAEYIDLLDGATISDGLLYIALLPLKTSLPELWSDVRFPSFVDEDKFFDTRFWLGPGNNFTPDRALLELGPGDMLFIPFYWWHAVWGIDQNMSINYSWPVRRANRLQHPRQTARWSFREAVLSAAVHRHGAQSSP